MNEMILMITILTSISFDEVGLNNSSTNRCFDQTILLLLQLNIKSYFLTTKKYIITFRVIFKFCNKYLINVPVKKTILQYNRNILLLC